jgi:iron complex transport system substrate-binding protein
VNRTPNRRDLIGLALAGSMSVALAGTATAQDATPGATPTGANGLQPDGTWAFTDDRGVTVTLPAMPTKLVLDANVSGGLWDFGVRPIGIFGWLSTPEADGTLPPAAGATDLALVENYGLGEGEIDFELLSVAAPDLIVTYTFAPDDPENLWSVLPDDLERIESIAPIIALSGVTSLPEGVARFAEFAAAVGADLNTPEIIGSQQGIGAAEDRAATLMSEKPGFSALWVAPSTDVFYVANPLQARGVIYARELGIKIPDLDVEPTEYWEELSYEQALKYPTDVLYVSTRNGEAALEQVTTHPTFSQHPAVVAGQVLPWNQDVVTSYPGQMAVLIEILTAMETFTDTVVEEDWI